MKTTIAIIFVFGGLIALITVHDTHWFREFQNPEKYWTEHLERSREMLPIYVADVAKCRAAIERLKSPSARQVWIKQKDLQGLSPTEAEADYESALNLRITICDAWGPMVTDTRRDIETARAKLNAMGKPR